MEQCLFLSGYCTKSALHSNIADLHYLSKVYYSAAEATLPNEYHFITKCVHVKPNIRKEELYAVLVKSKIIAKAAKVQKGKIAS